MVSSIALPTAWIVRTELDLLRSWIFQDVAQTAAGGTAKADEAAVVRDCRGSGFGVIGVCECELASPTGEDLPLPPDLSLVNKLALVIDAWEAAVLRSEGLLNDEVVGPLGVGAGNAQEAEEEQRTRTNDG